MVLRVLVHHEPRTGTTVTHTRYTVLQHASAAVAMYIVEKRDGGTGPKGSESFFAAS